MTKTNKGAAGSKRRRDRDSDTPDTPAKEKAPAKKHKDQASTRGRPKKETRSSKKETAEAGMDTDGGQEESNEGAPITVEWDKDEFNLTWKLVTGLTDNEDVKNALFPPTGGNASTKKGGGKKKTEHHWTLAKEIFQDHPDYSQAFALALKPRAKKLQNVWKAKIKNRLASMVTLVLKSRKEMGATGEGLHDASEVTLERFSPEFVNKWAAIQEKCPYYFEILGLIGERPNWTPVGLGNSANAIDNSVILGSGDPEDADTGLSKDDEMEDSGEEGSGEESSDEDGSEDGERPSEKLRRTRKGRSATPEEAKPKTGSGKKTPARERSGSSTPAGQARGKSKSIKGAFDFEELAKAEETTHQRELDIQQEKIRYNIQKVRSKTDIKMQREKNDFNLRRLEMEQRHQLMLEQMRLKGLSSSGHGIQGQHAFNSASASGPSSATFSSSSGSQALSGSQPSSMDVFGPGMGQFDPLGGGSGFAFGDGGQVDGLDGFMSYSPLGMDNNQ